MCVYCTYTMTVWQRGQISQESVRQLQKNNNKESPTQKKKKKKNSYFFRCEKGGMTSFPVACLSLCQPKERGGVELMDYHYKFLKWLRLSYLESRDWCIKNYTTENNFLLIKNPQFLLNFNETWSKLKSRQMENDEVVQKVWTKIFKILAEFEFLLAFPIHSPACLNFYTATSWPLRQAGLHGKSALKCEFFQNFGPHFCTTSSFSLWIDFIFHTDTL